MRYGYFDADAHEYVIIRPDTPRPWSNYIGSVEFGGVVTNHAAGFTFYKSAYQGRITRFHFNAPPRHWPGRYLYIRDMASGEIWTNSWLPAAKPLDKFSSICRHGLGYTTIRSDCAGIRSEVTYFVPVGATYEVWKVVVENMSEQPRRLRLFPFIEYQCNWNAGDDNSNLQYTQYIAKMDMVDGIIDHGSNVNMPIDPEHFENKDQKRHTFMAVAGVTPSGFDTDLGIFLGPSGTYEAPAAVVAGACSGSCYRARNHDLHSTLYNNRSEDLPGPAHESRHEGERRHLQPHTGVGGTCRLQTRSGRSRLGIYA